MKINKKIVAGLIAVIVIIGAGLCLIGYSGILGVNLTNPFGNGCDGQTSCVEPNGDILCSMQCDEGKYYGGKCGTPANVAAGYVKSTNENDPCAEKPMDGGQNICYCNSHCSNEGDVWDGSWKGYGRCCDGADGIVDAGIKLDSQGNCEVVDSFPSYKYVCIKCGDGICGTGENKCNCVQDCGICSQPYQCESGDISEGQESDTVYTRLCDKKEKARITCNEPRFYGYTIKSDNQFRLCCMFNTH